MFPSEPDEKHWSVILVPAIIIINWPTQIAGLIVIKSDHIINAKGQFIQVPSIAVRDAAVVSKQEVLDALSIDQDRHTKHGAITNETWQ